jgi:hypothetical protein
MAQIHFNWSHFMRVASEQYLSIIILLELLILVTLSYTYIAPHKYTNCMKETSNQSEDGMLYCASFP